ncbi:hypothetical protein M404DRAFT_736362 [Pisolithus tinctorius Marx 270]|uniref:Uncharacterized protein n=1 Tax=Pisolithus tinctorius Marx 270 TaxID=870435 RepID=A0A0C3IX09_PISTI|nr:hypothetical protein M404DRAFT_736362 [Pisolithus tinctorius Marx 270]
MHVRVVHCKENCGGAESLAFHHFRMPPSGEASKMAEGWASLHAGDNRLTPFPSDHNLEGSIGVCEFHMVCLKPSET